MEDNGPAKARTDATILGSFPTRRRILSGQTRNTRRIDRVEVLPVSSSMGNGSSQPQGNKRVSQFWRVRLATLSNACRNLTRNGNPHRALMRASKGSFEPINPMLV